MPHNSSQWITHTIDGGWATDYGKTHYASPENGSLSIPWLNVCENIKFYSDGSFGKYPGCFNIVTAPIIAPTSSGGFNTSSRVYTIFDYLRLGTSLTGTRKRVAIVGTFLYDISNALSIAPIPIGQLDITSSSIPHLTTFNDLLIIATSVTPKSWDQTTFQSLAGTPPNFKFSAHHAGRHWAAGISATPSKLHYSAVGNPEDWVGAGSGSIDIDPGDGDAITGILPWKNELWVFKGPYRLSIHRITGSSPSDFARKPFIYGISAAGQSSIFPVGNDFAFWSPRGSCHSLTATDTFGDYAQSYINYPILSWCRNPDNITGGVMSDAWQTVTDVSQNLSYSILNNHTLETVKSEMILMDWKFKSDSNLYPRFIRLPVLGKCTTVGMMASVFTDSRLLPTFGTEYGIIKQELSPNLTFYTNESLAFPYRVETPRLTYGPTYYRKTLAGASIDIVSNFNPLNSTVGTLELSIGGRGAPSQTMNFSNRGGVPLGTFVLGTDQLGSNGDIPNFYEATTGESEAFSYTLVEDSSLTLIRGNDVRVRHFSTLMTPSGTSMEAS